MARRRESATLAPLEVEILQVLSTLQSATVQQILDQMRDEKPPYSTVENVLIILHRKGKVVRASKGGAYHYGSVLGSGAAL